MLKCNSIDPAEGWGGMSSYPSGGSCVRYSRRPDPAWVSTPWGIWGVGDQVVIKVVESRFLRLAAHLFFPEQVAEHRVQVEIRHRVDLTEVLRAGYPTGSDLLYPVGVMENKLGCSTGPQTFW